MSYYKMIKITKISTQEKLEYIKNNYGYKHLTHIIDEALDALILYISKNKINNNNMDDVMETEKLNYQKRAMIAELRASNAEKKLESLITVVIALCTLMLGIIGYFNGFFSEGM